MSLAFLNLTTNVFNRIKVIFGPNMFHLTTNVFNRIKVIFVPVVPDPTRKLNDLFYEFGGNVEVWFSLIIPEWVYNRSV